MKMSVLASALVLAVLASLASGCGHHHKRGKGAVAASSGQHVLSVTGAGRALGRITADDTNDDSPALSPDGKTLLFNAIVYRPDGSCCAEQTIIGIDPQTGGRRTLYTSTQSHSSYPSWMPDGSGIVFASDAPGTQSIVRTLTSTPNAAITVVAGGSVAPGATFPRVSPGGKHVVLTTNIRGTSTVAIVGLDGSSFTILGEGSTPSWSPDGKRVVFQRNVNGVWQLFHVDSGSGGNLIQLTNDKYPAGAPMFSPDGRFIVFSTNRAWDTRSGGSEVGTWNLYLVRVDGTGLTQLTDGDGAAVEPFWGSDGWIYFSSNQAGNFDLWRLQPAGEFASASGASQSMGPGVQIVGAPR